MKKKRIIHSALSLSLTAALCLSMAACGGTQTPAQLRSPLHHPLRCSPLLHRRPLRRCR